jgi:hypothetical protein
MSIDHLRGPVKGVKSYDKICSHLIHTQDFSDYVDRIFRVLDSANVAGWEFSPGGADHESDPLKKRNVAPPTHRLLVDWGKKPSGEDNLEKVWSDPENWMIELSRICDDDELNQIVHKNFGSKTCPTYFCKKETLLGLDKDGSKSSKLDNKWAKYARNAISEKLMDKISRTLERIRQAMHSALASDAFAQEKVTFHERCIADEIKTVLLKFKDVAKPHVIKMAMDEFVCHEIMDSIVNVTGSDVDSFYDGNCIGPVGNSRQSEVDHLLSHAY